MATKLNVSIIFYRVWRDWIVENDTFVGLNFILGEPCGAVDREAKVNFNAKSQVLSMSTLCTLGNVQL